MPSRAFTFVIIKNTKVSSGMPPVAQGSCCFLKVWPCLHSHKIAALLPNITFTFQIERQFKDSSHLFLPPLESSPS